MIPSEIIAVFTDPNSPGFRHLNTEHADRKKLLKPIAVDQLHGDLGRPILYEPPIREEHHNISVVTDRNWLVSFSMNGGIVTLYKLNTCSLMRMFSNRNAWQGRGGYATRQASGFVPVYVVRQTIEDELAGLCV